MRALPRLGPYQVMRELARGGMGVVYEAVHEVTGARHAVKTVVRGAEAEEVARFRREAEVLGRLDHPHVVRVHAADLSGATPWMAQDLLPGGTLADRLSRGPLAIEDALALARKLTDALAHAHARGVLHRDLKPSNVVFDDRGEPRLVDFGLGRALDFARLTATGAVLGTPGFMAPELALGVRGDDVRTDVYGLGALLYAALTGRPPFEGASAVALFKAVTEKDAPPLRRARADAPAWLAAVVARALARRPEDRFQDVAALDRALADAGAGGSGGRRLGLVVVASLAAVGLVVAGASWLPEGAPADPGAVSAPAPAVTRSVTEVAPPAAAPAATSGEIKALIALIASMADVQEVKRRWTALGPIGATDRRAVAQACLDAARQGAEVAGGVTMRALAGETEGTNELVRYFDLGALAHEVDPSLDVTECEVGQYQQAFWSLACKKNSASTGPLMARLAASAPHDPVICSLEARSWSRHEPDRAREALLAQLDRLRGPQAGKTSAWFRGQILDLLSDLIDDQDTFAKELDRELERPDASERARELREALRADGH